MALDVCLGSLSCWKSARRPRARSDGSIFSFSIEQYICEFMMPLGSCEHWVHSNSSRTTVRCYGKEIKHKFIQEESTFPLPLITSLRPSLGGLPLETIQPLATWAEAWQAIPGVSDWVLGIIKPGYTLQFA